MKNMMNTEALAKELRKVRILIEALRGMIRDGSIELSAEHTNGKAPRDGSTDPADDLPTLVPSQEFCERHIYTGAGDTPLQVAEIAVASAYEQKILDKYKNHPSAEDVVISLIDAGYVARENYHAGIHPEAVSTWLGLLDY